MLDLSRVLDLEYSALQMLIEGERLVTESGAALWLAGLNPGVLDVVKHAGLAERLGHERMLFKAENAIHEYEKLLKS